jgi:ATP-dependent helicase/DNAse subunit B
MATLRIIAGPCAEANTAQLLVAKRESGLWIAPTRRAAMVLKERSGKTPHTFQQVADEIVHRNDAGARPLSDTQRRLLLDDVIAELDGHGTLPHYHRIVETRAFPEMTLGAIAELKHSGIAPEEFTAVAATDRERQTASIYAAYQQRMRRHHLYDQEGRVWYASRLLGDGCGIPFASARTVIVDGFAGFTPMQRRLLEALASLVEELWLAFPDEPTNDRAEMFARPRTTILSFAPLQPAVEMVESLADRPAGLAHLGRQLFRPRKTVQGSADAAGLLCLEAPGLVGEARMVAREIRQRLDAGTPPDDILVTMRDLMPYADLLREVLDEYEIPVDVEGTEPLARVPAIAMLLRTLRVPDDDWPFADVTAVLRSGWFRPRWPEVAADPEVASHAEALLRLLGEPRGRAVYLRAVRHWGEKVHPGLEDEQALKSRRQRTHELAKRCGPFLERFFHAWDNIPARGTLPRMTAWLRDFADTMGVSAAATEDERNARALARLWEELERWSRLHTVMHGERQLERPQFLGMLHALAATCGLARTPRGSGRVRVLSVELACGLAVDHVFIIGLGEGSFPRLSPPASLLDDAQRAALRDAGCGMTVPQDRLPDEKLLFFRLVTAARRSLTVSYPAVDDKGQELLPSSFLIALRDCFAPACFPVKRRRMLIEGFDRDAPLSPAERRVRAARVMKNEGPRIAIRGLAHDLVEQLRAAHQLTQSRFHTRDFTRHDGWLRDSTVVGDLQKQFGPDRILSPTALESYIACPFKFFLRHGLGLELLEEPDEEIESTDRGLAFHRALARLHTQLREAGVHLPDDKVEDHVLRQLDRAIHEQASRSSPAGEALWQIEGERLKRRGRRYAGHWRAYVEPWLKRGLAPRPELFEAGFGLPPEEGETSNPPLVIAQDDVEVRISGRIDRIDVVELPDGGIGFWVIDYKTGRAAQYTGTDLQTFRKLQLTLYALAAEQVLLRDRPARPLGLAYWLVVESGVKLALPRQLVAWLDEAAAWPRVRSALERWVVQLVRGIRNGEFPLQPRTDDCTQTCDFGQACRIGQSRAAVEWKTWRLPLPTID